MFLLLARVCSEFQDIVFKQSSVRLQNDSQGVARMSREADTLALDAEPYSDSGPTSMGLRIATDTRQYITVACFAKMVSYSFRTR